jgi:hypothetical protein
MKLKTLKKLLFYWKTSKRIILPDILRKIWERKQKMV